MGTSAAYFGGGSKNIQRGVLTIPSGSASGTATITAVDMSKAHLTTQGSSGTNGSASNTDNFAVLTNSTTVTATRSAGVSSGDVYVGFEVAEER